MTDDRKKEIERLAGIVFDKRRCTTIIGMQNINVEPQEGRKREQAYAVAKAEMYAAEKVLRDLQHGA